MQNLNTVEKYVCSGTCSFYCCRYSYQKCICTCL